LLILSTIIVEIEEGRVFKILRGWYEVKRGKSKEIENDSQFKANNLHSYSEIIILGLKLTKAYYIENNDQTKKQHMQS
jgi:hypothetical protein